MWSYFAPLRTYGDLNADNRQFALPTSVYSNPMFQGVLLGLHYVAKVRHANSKSIKLIISVVEVAQLI